MRVRRRDLTRTRPPALTPPHGYAAAIVVKDTPEIAETARHLAHMVENGRQIAAALRHLDSYGRLESSRRLAEILAAFLVERAEARHAGWRVVRQVIVDSAADAPWERCARRAIPGLIDDLTLLADDAGRTPLHRAQHLAARRRAEAIAPFVEPGPVLRSLDLVPERTISEEEWSHALQEAVRARSRERVARTLREHLPVHERE